MTEATMTGAEAGPNDPPTALGHLPSHLRLWIVTISLLAADLWSKSYVFAALGPHERRPLINHFIELQRSMNAGAVFGSLKGMVGLFIVASIVALGFVLVLFAGSLRSQWSLHIALGLVLAGALGNLYDRAFIRADVITFASGEEQIGTVLESSEEGTVHVGNWPDGSQANKYSRSEIISIKNQGVVRDFLKFSGRFPQWVPFVKGKNIWPWVFNVADAALVCGVGILVINLWRTRKPHPAPILQTAEA